MRTIQTIETSLPWRVLLAALAIFVSSLCTSPRAALADEDNLPVYLQDRGTGITTSLFGTYVKRGEWLFYPFYEYSRNDEEEYKPSELGFAGDPGEDVDFFAETREEEAILFLAYGLSDRLAVELEAEVWKRVRFEKSPLDTSAVPQTLEESGLGEVEAQLRYRWREETEHRPEIFGFFEVAFPVGDENSLIANSAWEAAVGVGVVRGFRWGTLTGRLSVAFDEEEHQTELGEYAFEYLKRVSPQWRLVATLEGEDDELVLVGEAQWHFGRHAFLKLNSGFGLTGKAEDWAPEIGVVVSLPNH